MSASLILAPVRVSDEMISWIRIKSELQPSDSWDVPWTNGAITELNQNSSHPWTNGACPRLMG